LRSLINGRGVGTRNQCVQMRLFVAVHVIELHALRTHLTARSWRIRVQHDAFIHDSFRGNMHPSNTTWLLHIWNTHTHTHTRKHARAHIHMYTHTHTQTQTRKLTCTAHTLYKCHNSHHSNTTHTALYADQNKFLQHTVTYWNALQPDTYYTLRRSKETPATHYNTPQRIAIHNLFKLQYIITHVPYENEKRP